MVSAMGTTYTSTNHREYCASHVLIDAHSLLFAGDRPRMLSGWFATRMRMLCLSCPDHGHHTTNRCICYSPVCCNRTGRITVECMSHPAGPLPDSPSRIVGYIWIVYRRIRH